MARIVCADCGRAIVEDDAEYRYMGCNEFKNDDNERFYQRNDGEFICEECFDENYFQCEDCNAIYPRDEECYEDGADRSVCPTCDETYTPCECCDERYESSDMRETIDDGLVCDHCYDRHYYTCCECGNAVRDRDVVRDDRGNHYCLSCYDEHFTRCCECDEELYLDDAYATPNGQMCEGCIERLGYVQCSRCGDYVPPEEIYTCSDGRSLCNYCSDIIRRESGMSPEEWAAELERQQAERRRAEQARLRTIEPPTTILSYHRNTERCFLSQDGEGTQMFFGIELETEAGGDWGRADAAAQTLKLLNQNTNGDIRNHWTAMGDGSLSNGFELISQPMTARYFDEEVAPVLKSTLKEMVRMGLRSHDTSTCGLHFHVSRNALNEDTMVNMEIAADKFRNTLVKISRRKNSSLERWADIVEIKGRFDALDKDVWEARYDREKGNLGSHGRYRALNFTNGDTVEFRACRGTLKYSSFIGCLHFFRFLIDWCASHTFRQILEEVSEEQFVADMAAYSPELEAYAIDRKLIEAEAHNDDEDVLLLAA